MSFECPHTGWSHNERVERLMHLVNLSAIAHDNKASCLCGQHHYIDGNKCPKCFMILLYDEIFKVSPILVQGALANKPATEETP